MLSEVGRGSLGDQIFAFPRWDPGRVPTARWATPRGVSPFPKRRSAPISVYPAGVSVLHTLGSKDPSWGTFRWSVRVQGLRAWGRSLRTPTCRRGHLQYLRSGPPYDFPRYRSTVHEVTQAFAAASREVLAVEAELSGPRGQPLLASHVRSLQQLEQTRLATVRPHPRPLSPSPRLVCRGPLCTS